MAKQTLQSRQVFGPAKLATQKLQRRTCFAAPAPGPWPPQLAPASQLPQRSVFILKPIWMIYVSLSDCRLNWVPSVLIRRYPSLRWLCVGNRLSAVPILSGHICIFLRAFFPSFLRFGSNNFEKSPKFPNPAPPKTRCSVGGSDSHRGRMGRPASLSLYRTGPRPRT